MKRFLATTSFLLACASVASVGQAQRLRVRVKPAPQPWAPSYITPNTEFCYDQWRRCGYTSFGVINEPYISGYDEWDRPIWLYRKVCPRGVPSVTSPVWYTMPVCY